MAKRDKKRDDLMLGAKLGLFDEKHRRKMGKAIWLFMPLQALTALDAGDGHIDYAQVEIINIAGEEWGFPQRTAYRYFRRLADEGYLRPREDGTWEITKYENFHLFLDRKKRSAKTGKVLAKTGIDSARSGKDSGSKAGIGVVGDIGEGEMSPPKREKQQETFPPSEKRASRKRDPRLDHPAIQIYRSLARLRPEYAVRDRMISCYEDVGENRWTCAIERWIAKGYNKRNVEGIMDVARNGFRGETDTEATRRAIEALPNLG